MRGGDEALAQYETMVAECRRVNARLADKLATAERERDDYKRVINSAAADICSGCSDLTDEGKDWRQMAEWFSGHITRLLRAENDLDEMLAAYPKQCQERDEAQPLPTYPKELAFAISDIETRIRKAKDGGTAIPDWAESDLRFLIEKVHEVGKEYVTALVRLGREWGLRDDLRAKLARCEQERDEARRILNEINRMITEALLD